MALQAQKDGFRAEFEGRTELVDPLTCLLEEFHANKVASGDLDVGAMAEIRALMRELVKAADPALSGTRVQRLNAVPESAMYTSQGRGVVTDTSAVEYDAHGNPIGADNELGVQGMGTGLTVVLLRGYHGCPLDTTTVQQLSYVREMLETFGCVVRELWYDTTAGVPIQWPRSKTDRTLETIGTTVVLDVETLARVLDGASQVWLMCGEKRVLTDEVVETLAEYHTAYCMGLHLLADNPPYCFDVNRILEKIQAPMFATGFSHLEGKTVKVFPDTADIAQMLENSRHESVQKHVDGREGNEVKDMGGVVPSKLTTGIMTMYGGITVAIVDDKACKLMPIVAGAATGAGAGAGAGAGVAVAAGAADTKDPLHARPSARASLVAHPILFSSNGGVTMYFIDGIEDVTGKLVVSGAFTQLLFNLNDAGVTRFYRNCVAWLGAV